MNIKFLNKNYFRQSRIKQTKNLVLTNKLTGFLNNFKWYKIFECVEGSNSSFQIKTIIPDALRNCDFIRELEETSILINDSGDFIEFLEIETLTMQKVPEIINLLDKLQVEYFSTNEYIEVYGYSR